MQMIRTGQEISVLYREPKLLKADAPASAIAAAAISVLYREPKLLKVPQTTRIEAALDDFSALP